MADVALQVLNYMHGKYGPNKPVGAALQHEGRGVPRHAKVDLITRFGRDMALGKALAAYQEKAPQ
ncbi:hypothetical protein J7643_02780 [bacterium]|nr:hypothetical protein [bacterium]